MHACADPTDLLVRGRDRTSSNVPRAQLVVLAASLLAAPARRRHPGAAGVWVLAQFFVRYRRSPLSRDDNRRSRGSRAGDRLPDTDVDCGHGPERLHGLLATPAVHLLLDRDAAQPDPSQLGPGVRAHRIVSRAGTGVRVVRPDGYLGDRAAAVTPALFSWLNLTGLGLRKPDPPPEDRSHDGAGAPAVIRRAGRTASGTPFSADLSVDEPDRVSRCAGPNRPGQGSVFCRALRGVRQITRTPVTRYTTWSQ
jgi:hypothetical protein